MTIAGEKMKNARTFPLLFSSVASMNNLAFISLSIWKITHTIIMLLRSLSLIYTFVQKTIILLCRAALKDSYGSP